VPGRFTCQPARNPTFTSEHNYRPRWRRSTHAIPRLIAHGEFAVRSSVLFLFIGRCVPSTEVCPTMAAAGPNYRHRPSSCFARHPQHSYLRASGVSFVFAPYSLQGDVEGRSASNRGSLFRLKFKLMSCCVRRAPYGAPPQSALADRRFDSLAIMVLRFITSDFRRDVSTAVCPPVIKEAAYGSGVGNHLGTGGGLRTWMLGPTPGSGRHRRDVIDGRRSRPQRSAEKPWARSG